MSARKVFVFLYALALAAVFCGASLNRALGQGPVAAPQNEVWAMVDGTNRDPGGEGYASTIARIDLTTLKGEGHLELREEKSGASSPTP